MFVWFTSCQSLMKGFSTVFIIIHAFPSTPHVHLNPSIPLQHKTHCALAKVQPTGTLPPLLQTSSKHLMLHCTGNYTNESSLDNKLFLPNIFLTFLQNDPVIFTAQTQNAANLHIRPGVALDYGEAGFPMRAVVQKFQMSLTSGSGGIYELTGSGRR